MDKAKLIINSQDEFSLVGDLTTIGRASDNDITLTEDSNISRYHAEIENRNGEFRLIDLGSSNGTTLNGEKVTTEKPFYDGDVIILGGSSKIEVLLNPTEEEKQEKEEESPTEENSDAESEEVPASAAAPKKSFKMPVMLIVASLAIGLAVIFVFAAGIFYFRQTAPSNCDASAKIMNLESGDVIDKPTQIQLDLQNGDCIIKAFFMLDGKEFASAENQPFMVTIDPAQLALSDDQTHRIQIILEDSNGNKIPQAGEVAVILRTIETETSTPDDEQTEIAEQNPQDNLPRSRDQGGQVSLIDINNMSQKILPQFSGKFKYNTNNKFFLQEVQKKTAEYVSNGYFERAKKYRDVIDTHFIQGRDLDPPLGYILAMSRSKFVPSNDSGGAGLWRMSNDLVVANAYNGLCGTETIADPMQNCAAIASSTYLQDLILRVFQGDIIYAVAAFGMSPEEAAVWKDTLPTDRKDFWNLIKSPKQREQIVNFFAAATVAENPQKFGLKNDRPLSELYKTYMK
ncbi:MAG: FHA domain-containing protein [Aridibacter sp.]